MKPIINLTNKTVLITGASSGMGRETARLVSSLGGNTILIARREEKLRETLVCMSGINRIYPYDLSDINGIEELIQQVIGENGPIDGFVHSAGVPGTRPLKMMKPDALRSIVNINFYSFYEICRCITKDGNYHPGLSIVGISSVSSKIGSRGKVAYAASKAAMDDYTNQVVTDYLDRGIRINTICPGLIETDIFTAFKNNAGDSEDAKGKLDRQYLGLGKPIDVANLIVFLLSNASNTISGQNINVDGGMLSS